MGRLEPVGLGQAGDRLSEPAGFQVDAAEVLQHVPAPRASSDGRPDAEHLLKAFGRLVCLAEGQAELTVNVDQRRA